MIKMSAWLLHPKWLHLPHAKVMRLLAHYIDVVILAPETDVIVGV